MKLDKFIISFANKGISLQKEDGSMPAGHNGPYIHKETSVRNTGHWIMIYAKSYEFTHDQKYIDAIRKAADYIISKKGRPHGGAFFHRIEGGDKANELIGPSWSFESLIKATQVLKDDKYLKVAEDVCLKYFFNKKKAVWNKLTTTSEKDRIDQTFNHQLWFAATSTLIDGQSKELFLFRASLFLSNIDKIMLQFEDGLIYHGIYTKLDLRSRLNLLLKETIRYIKLFLGDYKRQNRELVRLSKLMTKSIGYHSFNLYGFAILKKELPNHSFWDSKQFHSMLALLVSDKYYYQLESENYFGFPYNVPGFEIPVVAHVFNIFNRQELILFAEKYINIQIKKTFNIKTYTFDKNNVDQHTLNARFYEITRLPSDIIKEINVEI